MQDIKKPSQASKSKPIKTQRVVPVMGGEDFREIKHSSINRDVIDSDIRHIIGRDVRLEDNNRYTNNQKASTAEDDYFSVSKNKDRDIDGKLNAFEKRVSNYQSLSDVNKKNKKIAYASRNIKISISFAILFVISIILYFILTYVFNKTVVTVTPKVQELSINNVLSADLDLSNTENFNILELVKSEEATLPKSELQKVISKAKGKVTLYNNYSSSSQKLIKNTRLESESGRIFRITDSVILPGLQGISPGKIVVDVIADDVGQAYNISPSKFTIPGFKGTDRYKGFYAISDTQMSGGADGNKYVVAQEDIENTNSIKEANLLSTLIKEASLSLKDESFILATNTALYKYENNLTEYEFDKDDKYRVTGTIYVIAINKKYLAKLIAQKNIKDYNGEQVNIQSVDGLRFAFEETSIPNYQRLRDKQKVKVSISGNVKIVYDVNKDLVKNLLLGSDNNKQSFVDILAKMKNVDTAIAKVFPPWADKYPNNREKIEVIDIYDN